MDRLLPLLTIDLEDPDMNSSDIESEFNQLMLRNSAIQSCFTGRMSADELLDILESTDCDPVDYVDKAVKNMEEAQRRGVIITPDDWLEL